MVTPPPITRNGARSDAHRELSKAIYHQHDQSLTVRLLRYLGRRLDGAIDTTASHAPGGGVGLAALVVVVIVLIVVVVRRTGGLRRSSSSPVLAGTTVRRAADHRAAARAAAARDEWQTAVIEGMRAVVRELEERGVLDPRPGRTAAEVAVEVRARLPAVSDDVSAAAQTFDAVQYGGLTATAGDAETVRHADDAVLAARSGVRRPDSAEVAG